ncbi:MAG: hypothetical protein RL693_1111 [Verrucomicrobiota bacterium]|jgi:prevent-host-death family protein
MEIINIQAAKTHLSRLVEKAANGEEIIIGKAGTPMVRLVPYRASRSPRVGGQCKGAVWESDDCWESDEDLLNTSTPLYSVSLEGTSALKVAEKPS